MISQEIREEGLVGKLFFPKKLPAPAVIAFSGSDGGFHERAASLFAEAGFVSLALAFFHAEGLPDNLENIPLEYFQKGIRWLKNQPQVKSVHLYGPSKGGELVLVLASTFPDEIASACAVVPSCVTFGGIPNANAPSWTYKGQPLPIAETPSKEDVYKQLESRKTVNLVEIYQEKMKHPDFEKALIPVEKIRCPFLLISGKEDKMWPSSLYCEKIMERLRSPKKHLCYEHVGHMITNPYDPVMTEPFYHPVTQLYYELGGDPQAQKKANEDSWKQILAFFKSP